VIEAHLCPRHLSHSIPVPRHAGAAGARSRAISITVSANQYLGALAAQLLHACSDHRKIVSGSRSGAFAAQFLHTCADHRKIVSGAVLGHASSVFL